MVPSEKFRVLSGTVKQFTRKGISGHDLTYNMCDNCGSLVFVKADAMPDSTIVKMGTVDDENILNGIGYPGLEIFIKDRLHWAQPIPGAEQKEIA